tara:strand:+ start:107 stop:1138 length:1032 start_codon:yes stop_codon:yes gene_type:complete
MVGGLTMWQLLHMATTVDGQACSDDASWLRFWNSPLGIADFGPAAAQRYPAYVGRALMLLQGNAHFGKHVIVDIGANKGVMSAGFFESMCPSKMRRWDLAVRTDPELAKALGRDAVGHAEQHDKVTQNECPVIHAIEADPRIATALLPRVPGIHGFPQARFKVHNIGMYSEDGEMAFALDGSVGGELGALQVGSHRRPRPQEPHSKLARVQTMTYDTFAAQHSIQRASWVKVDAEGIDPYILHGMEKSLRTKAIIGLQLEYSDLWERKNSSHTLLHAVNFLDELGYHTYYAGRTMLMPLWGSHFHIDYGRGRGWTDLVALQANSTFEHHFRRLFRAGPRCIST